MLRSGLRVGAVLLSFLVLPVGTGARQEPQRAQGTIREGVTAVLVDVVVRDRRGQPVRDLTAADFEILEDGVVQTLGSFTPIAEGSSSAPPPAPAPAVPSPAAAAAQAPAAASGPGVTALVFHSLSPDGRRRAIQAARNYVGLKEETTSNYLAVFGLDLSLAPLVPFTRNAVALRQALDQMGSRGSSAFRNAEQQQQKADLQTQAQAARRATAAAEAAAGPGGSGNIGGSAADAQLAQMQANMIDKFMTMDSEQAGYAAVNGLFAIVNTLGRLPGRKSVVLFSEGIAIPPAVHRLFLGVIDAANRANVSIYTIDAAGLRTGSDQATIRDAVNAAASVGINTGYSVDGAGSAYTGGLEANEANLRSDPAYGLGQLARDTGGLLFNNTNNMQSAFDRIDNDLRNYYLLGYTPSNTKYDGKFRTIQVKVKRPNLQIAARKGYFAVRDPGGLPLNEWEAPALGAFEQKPVPNAFPVRASALLFPERGRPGLVPVVVEFKTAPLTFAPADDRKTYSSDFTVLVRFVDEKNQVARKVSQHYEVKGPLAEIDRARQGDVIFYRESELPPGVYSMETIVYDGPSGKASVRFATVEVPRSPDNRLRMSSLVLVKRGEKVTDNERRNSPLIVKDVIVHPNLGEPVSKAAQEAGFYFAIYPAKDAPAPNAVLHLLQNEKLIAQIPVPLAAADAAGRVQQLGRLPIGQIPAGTYELRAIVKQGNDQVFSSTMLRIVD